MFEEYLQDAAAFLSEAIQESKEGTAREARRFYRASAFYAYAAIEAFVNHLGDTFSKAATMQRHEICFLNDTSLSYRANKGFIEKTEYHKLDEKLRFLIGRFGSDFDFESRAWVKLKEFKKFRDSLVHPRQDDDQTSLPVYEENVKSGLRAVIEVMNHVQKSVLKRPLRKRLLELIPD
jgi:hypothetical protein